MAPLLEIKGLKTHFSTDDGILQAVDGVDISINRGETLCVVGESGCGKTVTAMSILKLIAMPPGRIAAGQIIFEEDTVWNRVLHNETAFLIQRRLQHVGVPMIVLPVQLDLRPEDRHVPMTRRRPEEAATTR